MQFQKLERQYDSLCHTFQVVMDGLIQENDKALRIWPRMLLSIQGPHLLLTSFRLIRLVFNLAIPLHPKVLVLSCTENNIFPLFGNGYFQKKRKRYCNLKLVRRTEQTSGPYRVAASLRQDTYNCINYIDL